MDFKKMISLTEAFLRPQKLPEQQINIDTLLRQFRKYEDYVWIFFDTETTGFHPRTAQIVQIAAEVITPDFLGKEIELKEELSTTDTSFHAVCALTSKHLDALTPEKASKDKNLAAINKEMLGAFKVNKYDTTYGINPEDKPSEEEALKAFSEFLNNHGGKEKVVLIAHNAPFDMQMITVRGNGYGISFDGYNSIDTVQMAQKIWYPLLRLQKSGILDKLGKGRTRNVKHSFSLESISKALNINASNMHNAIKDVENMMIAAKEMLTQLSEAGAEEKQEIQNRLDRTRIGRKEFIDKLKKDRTMSSIARNKAIADLGSRDIGTESDFADKYRQVAGEYAADDSLRKAEKDERDRKKKLGDVGMVKEGSKARDFNLKAYLDSLKDEKEPPKKKETDSSQDSSDDSKSEDGKSFEKVLKGMLNKVQEIKNVLEERKKRKKKGKKKGKKDSCYYSAKRKYKVFPSAYASGYIVRCRKGQVSEDLEFDLEEITDILTEEIYQMLDEGTFDKEKSQGLHGWFARQGGKGKSKGWVDCNTCRKDKKTGRKTCKSCGRQDGEKRGKYPACRPTPSACNSSGTSKKKSSKRVSWKKKKQEE